MDVNIHFDFQSANSITDKKTITPTPTLSIVWFSNLTTNKKILDKSIAVTTDKMTLVDFFINTEILLKQN